MVLRGSGVGFMPTETTWAPPGVTVKCAPSILKSLAVTEIRYFPGTSPSRALERLRADWSPCATTGANPLVVRVLGQGQVSA